MKRSLPLFTFLLLTVATSAQSGKIPKRAILPPELKEVSGMTRLPNGDLWMLNDSRNPSNLYRYDPLAQKLLETRVLPVQNFDWEDLASDPSGNLYIGDFGNNNNRRKNLRIFIYNPASGALDSLQFQYPDQTEFPPADTRDWNFNMEAFVFFQDSLHLFSKNVFKGNFYTKHYVLPAKPGNYVAVLKDSIRIKNRVVTGAAISQDGKTLALTAYIIGKRLGFIPYSRASAIFISHFPDTYFLRGKKHRKRLPKMFIARQFESITQWQDNLWLVANEGRAPQFQAIWRMRKK